MPHSNLIIFIKWSSSKIFWQTYRAEFVHCCYELSPLLLLIANNIANDALHINGICVESFLSFFFVLLLLMKFVNVRYTNISIRLWLDVTHQSVIYNVQMAEDKAVHPPEQNNEWSLSNIKLMVSFSFLFQMETAFCIMSSGSVCFKFIIQQNFISK